MAGNSAFSIKDSGYSQILKQNTELSKTVSGEEFVVDILSNITVNPIKEILELSLRLLSVKPVIRVGNYDNIVQDSYSLTTTDLILVFYELVNFADNFHLQAELMSEAEVQTIIEKGKGELSILFKNLSGKPMVLFNLFSSYPFGGTVHNKRNLAAITNALNGFLQEHKPGNFQLIDIDRIVNQLGAKEAYDGKKFLKYKSLYKIEFLKWYVDALENTLRRRTGKLKKALIFDCDNTLWKGVIGEDGPEGIDMSPKNEAGSQYQLVQKIAANLSRKGVLLCLCSKNNPAEVEGLLGVHPDMHLTREHLVATKVNWQPKNENLRALAKELNIGLDSFVFIDDSDFEVNLIRTHLPEVTTVAVPKDISTYASVMMDVAQRYFNLEPLKEDLGKVKAYKEQAQRAEAMEHTGDIDTYLATLETRVVISNNPEEQIPRIAQLTQKTNQFNFTTRRYSEAEISAFVSASDTNVFTVDVSDKFGESGITGVIIVKDSLVEESVSEIDSFLLSCRILGRKIEVAFLNYVLQYYKRRGCKTMRAAYLPTAKNGHVATFYPDHQFVPDSQTGNTTAYKLNLKNHQEEVIPFIQLLEPQHL